MPLDGTLKDLSLPSLIQLQCAEQRRVHVRLTRSGRTGELVFAGGELIHASVEALLGVAGSATLTGDAAVYELLTWEEGEFHVSDGLSALPARTVVTPSNALLLEGLHQLDERRAERNATLEQALKNMKAQHALRRAIVVDESGHVHADATDGTASQDAALIAFVTGRIQAIGATLNLGAFRQFLCTLPSEKTLIAKIDAAYLAAWLDVRSLPEPLKALLRSLKIERS